MAAMEKISFNPLDPGRQSRFNAARPRGPGPCGASAAPLGWQRCEGDDFKLRWRGNTTGSMEPDKPRMNMDALMNTTQVSQRVALSSLGLEELPGTELLCGVAVPFWLLDSEIQPRNAKRRGKRDEDEEEGEEEEEGGKKEKEDEEEEEEEDGAKEEPEEAEEDEDVEDDFEDEDDFDDDDDEDEDEEEEDEFGDDDDDDDYEDEEFDDDEE